MPTVACTLQRKTTKAAVAGSLAVTILTFQETGSNNRLGSIEFTYQSTDTDFAAATALALGAAGTLTY